MKLFGQKLTFTALFGLVVTTLFLLVVLLAPWIAPFGEAETVGGTWDLASAQHWLGTDQIGRDMFTRILYGTRMTIAVAFAITLMSFFIGIVIGFTSAVLGGWVDTFFSRLVDVMLSIPSLIFALIILGVFRLQHSGADPDHCRARRHPRVPPLARARHEPDGDGIRRGRQTARRGPVVGHHP